MAQDLVLGRLKDIAGNGEKFRGLQAQGRQRLGRQIGELREELGKREEEVSAVKPERPHRIFPGQLSCCFSLSKNVLEVC